MPRTVMGPTPFLKVIHAEDNTRTSPHGKENTYEETMITGFVTTNSKTDTETNTRETHMEVSAEYGFSLISSITATVGSSTSRTSSTSKTCTETMTRSRSVKIILSFPQGEWRGVYKWAVRLKTKSGHAILILDDEPLVTLTSKKEKDELEAAARRVTLTGTAYAGMGKILRNCKTKGDYERIARQKVDDPLCGYTWGKRENNLSFGSK